MKKTGHAPAPPVAAIAAVLALAVLVSCDDTTAGGSVAPGDDLAPVVLAFCRDSMARMDCDCFWRAAAPAFNAGNVNAILTALAERDQYGPMITRGRLEKVAGEEETRRLGRALYDCVDLKAR